MLQSGSSGTVIPGSRPTSTPRVIADVPARSLAEDGPTYHRSMQPPAALEEVLDDDPTFAAVAALPADAFFRVLSSPNVASKRWA